MKTVLVTGATDGIGRETARRLLEKGLRVFVHGRTMDRARSVIEELQHSIPSAQAEPVYADLANMRQVLALAEQVREREPVLDVLINNAAVYEPKRVRQQAKITCTFLSIKVIHFCGMIL